MHLKTLHTTSRSQHERNYTGNTLAAGATMAVVGMVVRTMANIPADTVADILLHTGNPAGRIGDGLEKQAAEGVVYYIEVMSSVVEGAEVVCCIPYWDWESSGRGAWTHMAWKATAFENIDCELHAACARLA